MHIINIFNLFLEVSSNFIKQINFISPYFELIEHSNPIAQFKDSKIVVKLSQVIERFAVSEHSVLTMTIELRQVINKLIGLSMMMKSEHFELIMELKRVIEKLVVKSIIRPEHFVLAFKLAFILIIYFLIIK